MASLRYIGDLEQRRRRRRRGERREEREGKEEKFRSPETQVNIMCI